MYALEIGGDVLLVGGVDLDVLVVVELAVHALEVEAEDVLVLGKGFCDNFTFFEGETVVADVEVEHRGVLF